MENVIPWDPEFDPDIICSSSRVATSSTGNLFTRATDEYLRSSFLSCSKFNDMAKQKDKQTISKHWLLKSYKCITLRPQNGLFYIEYVRLCNFCLISSKQVTLHPSYPSWLFRYPWAFPWVSKWRKATASQGLRFRFVHRFVANLPHHLNEFTAGCYLLQVLKLLFQKKSIHTVRISASCDWCAKYRFKKSVKVRSNERVL